MTGLAWIAAAGVAALAAYVQATVGIGFAMIAAPAFLLILPGIGPAAVLLTMLGLAAIMSIRDRAEIDYQGLVRLLPGLTLGAAVAVAAMPALPPDRDRIVGAVVLAAAIWVASGMRLPTGLAMTVALGFGAGFLGTVSGIHGPALALLYADAPRQQARATIAMTFVLACVISLAALAAGSHPMADDLRTGIMLLPAAAIGWSIAQVPRLVPPEQVLRLGALALVAASGAVLAITG